MHTYYDVTVDGIHLFTKGIYAVKRPNMPSPEKVYITHDIMGADGSLYVDTGNYSDITLDIEFNYLVDEDLWAEAFRQAKRYILNGKELRLSDDQNVYYKIKKVNIGTSNRPTKRIGKFTATFTLDPYAYFVNGKYPVDIVNGQIYNKYDQSLPRYELTGSGNGKLIVNGKQCSFTQSVIIDTTKKCTFVDGEVDNTAISGRYSDLVLNYGINTVSIEGNYTLKVIPNWRQI